jgi:hypothetical protein
MAAPPLPGLAGADGIAHVIQLSIAPVFLLSGVGALLGVLSGRLARIVDRGRRLEERVEHAKGAELDKLHEQFARLTRRAKLMNWSISLGTGCALLICAVIVTLFAGALLAVDVTVIAALLFVLGMLALIGCLVCFLREIYLATVHLRLGPH